MDNQHDNSNRIDHEFATDVVDEILEAELSHQPGLESPGAEPSGRSLYSAPLSGGVPPRPEGRGLPRLDEFISCNPRRSGRNTVISWRHGPVKL